MDSLKHSLPQPLRLVKQARCVVLLFLFCLPALSRPTAPPIKLACVGNSITAGSNIGGAANAYPAYLQKLLGSGYTVKNFGVSATTLLKNGDLPYWTKGMMPDVFTFQPDVVTIKLGTNDTKPQNWDAHKSEFKNDYLAMIDTFANMASHPKIWLLIPVPVIGTNTYGIRDTALQKIIVIVKQIAAEKNLPLIDLNTPLLGKSQLFISDGVHPTAAGEDTLAHIIYRNLMAPPTGLRNLAIRRFPKTATLELNVDPGKILFPFGTDIVDSKGAAMKPKTQMESGGR